ncbi:uncharacterized protein LOC127259294 isoform X2 [Andrographis paniculata]|uniref:uncharacterized protein LOC127259294 isoform X2 n=1 Tax=Andrographis paniculata TaxID=175694 RepID=UPI0021E8BFF1|nr:uncharacterized protein LOC127259294 isoform X2 [Andrographis paniculata]
MLLCFLFRFHRGIRAIIPNPFQKFLLTRTRFGIPIVLRWPTMMKLEQRSLQCLEISERLVLFIVRDDFLLHGSDHLGMMLVTTPFDGSNFLDRRTAIEDALIAKSKIGFIDGTIPIPEETHWNWNLHSREELKDLTNHATLLARKLTKHLYDLF